MKRDVYGLNLSTKDYEGYRAEMIQKLKEKIPEYSDFSPSDFGIVLIELLAHGLDTLSIYNDKVANELFLDTAMERESVERISRMIGYKLGDSVPSKYEQVFEIIPQDEDFTIPKGYVVQTNSDAVEQIVEFETDENLVIPKGKTGLETDEHGKYLYSTTVTQGYSVTGEIIGSSNGSPNQTFLCNYAPVIASSLEVYVNEGRGFDRWEIKDNFLDSKSTSKHCIVFITDDGVANIKFGNGISGKIPDIRTNNILVNYRVGGGSVGNVGVRTITKMPEKFASIKRSFNPFDPIAIGRDREDIEEARIKAPANIGTKYGVVTLSDFKNLALSIPGVKRSNAIRSKDRLTMVNVYYLSDGTIPHDELEQNMIDLYDERKVVGTHVTVEEATLRPLNIRVTAKTFNTYKGYDIQQQILVTLEHLLLPGHYDFGQCPEQSDLVVQLLDLDGVRAVDVEITNNNNLKPNEIVKLGRADIEIIGGR